MSDLLAELGIDTDEPQQKKYTNIYRAVRHDAFGVDCNGRLVFGLTFRLVSEGNWYDPLTEKLEGVGQEAELILTPEGIIEGAYYESCLTSESTDYLTGEVKYAVYIRRVL